MAVVDVHGTTIRIVVIVVALDVSTEWEIPTDSRAIPRLVSHDMIVPVVVGGRVVNAAGTDHYYYLEPQYSS